MLVIVASYHRLQFQRKLMIQTQENGEKPYFGPVGSKFVPLIFFKNLASSVTRYHGQLSYNDPMLRKFSDGRAHGQMDRPRDRQMDKSDFIGRCTTNVECPKAVFFLQNKK